MAMSFEQAMKNLEQIVENLESGSLELEESLKLFEEGIALSRYCQKLLQEAEGRIQRLIENESGELILQELNIEEQG
ncbi:exodeoxyribonuclease VII small subunit [Syntrophomonas palmitatica]|uniref:exodeoxyribonuclease VII small subunit n=1 Tax=Syntrophomonas palmitatica TaxID=402877 RepID=UPI0006D1DF8A|nr:exodeoxyribonuclease VII small subunit [Syntrophomonas palmitatica]